MGTLRAAKRGMKRRFVRMMLNSFCRIITRNLNLTVLKYGSWLGHSQKVQMSMSRIKRVKLSLTWRMGVDAVRRILQPGVVGMEPSR